MSLALRVDLRDVSRLSDRLARIGRASPDPLLDAVGALLASSAKRRIRSEKRGPDGEPWRSWTPAYAATRHAGQSLLLAGGGLDDSITHLVAGHGVEVGSNLVYAAIHQLSGAGTSRPNIPARPYLGVSDEDAQDIVALAEDWADGLLEALR